MKQATRNPTLEFAFRTAVGRSSALTDAIALAHKVAASHVRTILLIGETGTGKELFARGIHYAGATANEPFVAVNCAAIPPTLLESELFGYERGAFTDAVTQKRGLIEVAGRGTLLLDEITELPPHLQAKLLRVLEERTVRRIGGTQEIEVRCRVISATQSSLETVVERGEFRDDLMYRLSGFRIQLPALRERQGDVPILARHFLEMLARDEHAAPKRLSEEAERVLQQHTWPGNIRELKNVIERAAVLSEGDVITPDHILIQRRSRAPITADAAVAGEIRIPTNGLSMDEIEREAIRLTLELSRGNRSETARILGISRPTLHRKIRKYQLRTA